MNSYIELQVEGVKLLCDQFLKARKERIAKQQESEIQKMIGTRPFFRPWKKRNRSEAVSYLDEDFSYCMIEVSGSRWSDEVEKLTSLCNLASPNTTINLSSDLAYILLETRP